MTGIRTTVKTQPHRPSHRSLDSNNPKLIRNLFPEHDPIEALGFRGLVEANEVTVAVRSGGHS